MLGTVGAGFPAIETARNLITSLAVADSDEWQIYVGTYDGHLFASVGGRKPGAVAADWPDVTGNLPLGTISSIAVNPANSADVWVTISNFSTGNKLWHRSAAGGAWTASGPPATGKLEPAKVVKIDPRNPQALWLGTDRGVWWSGDSGAHWARRSANLPNVPVFDIEIDRFENRVFAATHRRGV